MVYFRSRLFYDDDLSCKDKGAIGMEATHITKTLEFAAERLA